MRRKTTDVLSDLDKQSTIALRETLARRTVAIVYRQGLSVGSGVCLEYKGNLFVITAAHVAKNHPPEDIYFIAMPDVPLTETPEHLAFSERFLPPLDGVTVSPSASDDLALLHLSSRPPEMQHMEFYSPRLPEPTRPIRKQVVIHGFPGESGRALNMNGERAGAVFPYFDYPPVAHISRRVSAELSTAVPPYRPLTHILLQFPPLPPDSDLLKSPGGMSGGGVWKITERGPDDLWIPTDARLMAIIVWYSSRRGVIISTRSKRVWRLLAQWEQRKSRG